MFFDGMQESWNEIAEASMLDSSRRTRGVIVIPFDGRLPLFFSDGEREHARRETKFTLPS